MLGVRWGYLLSEHFARSSCTSKFRAECCRCNYMYYYHADRLAYGDFSWMKVKC